MSSPKALPFARAPCFAAVGTSTAAVGIGTALFYCCRMRSSFDSKRHGRIRKREGLLVVLAPLLLAACLPNSDGFVVDNAAPAADRGPVNDGTTTTDSGVGEDSGFGSRDGGGAAQRCTLPPTCDSDCGPWMLLTTLSVPGCNGVVLRHSISARDDSPGACLCDSHSGFFDSEISDAFFVAPNTLLVVGQGHLQSLNTDTGEARWTRPLSPETRHRLEPTADDAEVYLIAGEEGQGPIMVHRVDDGSLVRSVPGSAIGLTSLVANYADRNSLLGLSPSGQVRAFDTRTRQSVDWAYPAATDRAPIARLNSSQGYSATYLTALHEDNTLSNNRPPASALLDACRSGSEFEDATAILAGYGWAAITVEGPAPSSVYLKLNQDSCTPLLAPGELAGEHTIHRVRSVWPSVR